MTKRTTMRDIAAAAEVSVATVSQILSDRKANFCSEQTKAKVRRIASELGYRTNIGYQLMHHLPTRTVGIMIAHRLMLQEEHHRELVLRLLHEFGRLGYAAYSHFMPETSDEVRNTLKEFAARGVEHFVFVGSPAGWETIEADLRHIGVTAVFTREVTRRFVAHDVTGGVEKLFRFLLAGCGENFKLVCPQSWAGSPYNNRVDALERIFPERSRDELIEQFVFPFPPDETAGDYAESAFDSGVRVTRELLKQYPDLAGIAYLNDLLAWGGASELLTARRRPVLTGCNYERVMRHFPIPFSTLEFDLESMVPQLAEAALSDAPCQKMIPAIPHISPRKKEK